MRLCVTRYTWYMYTEWCCWWMVLLHIKYIIYNICEYIYIYIYIYICVYSNTIHQCDCVPRGIHNICILNGVAGEWCCYIYDILYIIHMNISVYIYIFISQHHSPRRPCVTRYTVYTSHEVSTSFIPKLLLRCGLLAWTRFRLILKKAGALSGL